MSWWPRWWVIAAEVRRRPDVAEEELDRIEVSPGVPYTAKDVHEGRRLVAELDDLDRQLGGLALEVVTAYRSEAGAAAGPLGVLADKIGEDVKLLLASRRYVITGDRRAVEEYRASLLAVGRS